MSSSLPLPSPPSSQRMALTTSFEVHVTKEDFKFHAAHFVAFQGYRERLHGHNYKCGVRLKGSRTIAHDGYVVDFGDVKKAVRVVCKQLNEHFICPMLSDVMTIETTTTTPPESSNNNNNGETVTLTCQDGSVFQFPKNDCAMLPIVHATAEELAIYLWSRILEGLDAQTLRNRGVHTMEVIVAEAVGQEAVFRLEIPNDPSFKSLDVPSFIQKGQVIPTPCPSYDETTNDNTTTLPSSSPVPKNSTSTTTGEQPPPCCDGCLEALSSKLEALAKAINDLPRDKPVTVEDLKPLIQQS